MQRVWRLYQSTVGKKFLMALSGLVLVGFVLGHMAGNLKVFQGAEKFNAYAEFLREVGYPLVPHGGLLWVARIVLLACLAVHVVAVVQLWSRSRQARSQRYKVNQDLSFSYASRTMRWGGLILLAFVVYHLLHLTVGVVHPAFDHTSPYNNVVVGFGVWWVTIPYALAVLSLGVHVYHGLWSSTQTLALRSSRVRKWRRPVAAGAAAFIVVGYLLVPASVVAGLVRVSETSTLHARSAAPPENVGADTVREVPDSTTDPER